MTTKISKRLKAICDFVPYGSSIIDVGCDHAYISIYLAKNKNCTAIATDISPNSIERAKKNIKGLNIKTMVTDGINGVDLENKIIVIAGMGGDTIMKILNKDIKNDLIISSQSDIPKVREFMHEKNYRLANEKVVYENKHYYVVSYYKYGKGKKYSVITPYIKDNKDYIKYLYDKYKLKYTYSKGIQKLKYKILLLNLKKCL